MQNDQDTILDVTGMSCRSCIRHIDGALSKLPGVRHIAVDLKAGTVQVRHDPRATTVKRLIAALDAAGYGASERSIADAS